jgi:hypothetical protein
MKTRIYVFEENSITFTLDKDNKVMVNATEMAKVFGTDVFQFTRIDSTKEFVKLPKTAILRFIRYQKRRRFD